MDDDLLARVRDLHRPRWYDPMVRSGQVWLVCRGCDEGAHAEDPPGWPCRTADLVYSEQERADREPPQLPGCPDHPRAQAVFVRTHELGAGDLFTTGPLQARRWGCEHVMPVPVDSADPWD